MAKKTLSQLVVEVQADVARLKKDMGQMSREVSSFTQGATKMFKGLGLVIAGAFSAVAIKAGIQESLSRFMEYESALSRIGNVTKESLGAVEEKLKTLGPEYGTLAENARGYYNVLSAGVTDAQQSMDVFTASAKMAAESGNAQGEAVKCLAALMSSYGAELKTASDAADLLYGIEAKGITTVQELIPLIGSLANQASAVGLSADEMGAALAQVTKAGQGTSEATTQLQAVMTGLIKPTTEMRDLLLKYGGAQRAIKDLGFAGVLQLIAEKTKGNSEALGELFGRKEAMLGFFQLSKSNFTEFGERLDEMKEKTGLFEDAWKRYQETLKGIWETFKNTVGNIMIELGEKLAPAVKDMLTDMRKWLEAIKDPVIEKFGQWMDKLRAAYQGMRNYIAAIVEDIRAWARSNDAIMQTGLVGWLKEEFVPAVKSATSAVRHLVSMMESVKDAADAAADAISRVNDLVTGVGAVKKATEMVVKFTGEGSTKKPILEKINEIRDAIGEMRNYAAQNAEYHLMFQGSFRDAPSPLGDCMDRIAAAEEALRAQMIEPIRMTVDTTLLEQALDRIGTRYMDMIGNLISVFGMTLDPAIANATRNNIEHAIEAWKTAQEAAKHYFGKGGMGYSLNQYGLGGYTGDQGGMVHPREFVIPEDSVRYYGLSVMESLRRKTLEREALVTGSAREKSPQGTRGGAGHIPAVTFAGQGRVPQGNTFIVNSRFLNGTADDGRRLADQIEAALNDSRRRRGIVPYAHRG